MGLNSDLCDLSFMVRKLRGVMVYGKESPNPVGRLKTK
jgi:hypothetical protein